MPKVLEKSRAIPLLTLRAWVAYKKGENLATVSYHTENTGLVIKKADLWILNKEMTAASFNTRTEHTKTLCGQNA